MKAQSPKLSIFFIPFCTASHLLPMVDAARLLASGEDGGVVSHIVTTYRNASLFENTLNQDIQHHASQIILHKLHFPYEQVGLPEGVENFNSTNSTEMNVKVHMGLMLLKKPIEELTRDYHPDCIVSDMFFPWTLDLAEELQIPRIHFNPTGYFARSVIHNLETHAPHQNVNSETETFEIPGLPDPIHMKRSQLEAEVKTKTAYRALRDQMEEAESKSFGTILNSFSDLEPAYIQYFNKVKPGLRFWNISPLPLFCRKSIVTETAMNRDQYECLSWLDSQKPNSVLYVCFGSMALFSAEQLKEISMALESSGNPFLWVCRPPQNISEDEPWLSEGFEDRIRKRNKGFLVKGWAPQVMILDHPSVAGFMSHCGWNSVIETLSAGVPLITWPLFSEHFYNEKFMVDVLKMGIEVGAEYWNDGFTITSPTIEKEKIEKALQRFFSGSDEMKTMRDRAKEVKKKANEAVEKGGSSYSDLMAIISDLTSLKMKKKKKHTHS